MYAFIEGKIAQTGKGFVVVKNNGIGFLVNVPGSADYKVGDEVLIHTHLHVKEDVMALYGLASIEQKEAFKRLLGVMGVGPKGALSVAGYHNYEELQEAINNGDISFLIQFPGIGRKNATQIIVDLKNKLGVDETENPKVKDVIDALVVLGYKRIDIRKIIKKLDFSQPLDELVVSAVKELTK